MKITSKEFEQNFDKYNELAAEQVIEVTENGKVIYTIVPQYLIDEKTFESFCGRLPKDATIGEDPFERG